MTEQRTPGPQNFRDAAKGAIDDDFRINRMTPDEIEQAERDAEHLDLGEPDTSPLGRAADANAEDQDPNATPAWVQIPPDLVFPKGKVVGFLRFKAKWTDSPQLGDRNIILWGLTDADEKLAIQAARGESGRTITEMAKRTIRAIDGKRADWTGKTPAGNVNKFWNEIGPKCRPLIVNAYWKTHSLTVEETADFLVDCIAFRDVVAG